MKILIRLFLVLLIACLGVGIGTSCSEDNDCSLAGRAMMNCTFYSINPETKAVLKDTLDSLTVTAFGTDSIILNNQKKVHTLQLPLRYTSDSTVFILHYDYKRRPTYVDTLYVVQKNTPYFQSMECGYTMKQLIQKTTYGNGVIKGKTRIDSLHILNNNANTNGTQNLEIFYQYRDRTIG